MAGFVKAVAVDLDGTLTKAEGLSGRVLAALGEVQQDGVAAVLVTGRIPAELEQAYPGLVERFDAVVAENGAVLIVEEDVRSLAAPVEELLAAELSAREVRFRRGQVLLAGDAVELRPCSRRSGHWGSTVSSFATAAR